MRELVRKKELRSVVRGDGAVLNVDFAAAVVHDKRRLFVAGKRPVFGVTK